MFVKIDTLEVVTYEELSSRFTDPWVLFPRDIKNPELLEYGYAVLEYDPIPTLGMLESYTFGVVRAESGGHFVQTYVVIPPSESDWVAFNTDKINSSLRQANAQITAIQGRIDMINDAIDIGEDETGWVEELPSRKSQLTLWKKYRIDLNKIVLQPGWASNVIWPILPTPYTDEMSSAVLPTAILS